MTRDAHGCLCPYATCTECKRPGFVDPHTWHHLVGCAAAAAASATVEADVLDQIDSLADQIAARNENEDGGMHHDLDRIRGAARMLREIYAGRETIV